MGRRHVASKWWIQVSPSQPHCTSMWMPAAMPGVRTGVFFQSTRRTEGWNPGWGRKQTTNFCHFVAAPNEWSASGICANFICSHDYSLEGKTSKQSRDLVPKRRRNSYASVCVWYFGAVHWILGKSMQDLLFPVPQNTSICSYILAYAIILSDYSLWQRDHSRE